MATSAHGKRSRRQRLSYWLLLAAAIHFELLIAAGVILYYKAPRNADLAALAAAAAESESIEITTLDDETARRLLAEIEVEQEREEEQKREEERKKEEEAPDAPGQTVDLAKPVEEKRPDKARFAAEYDSTVEKETRKYGRFDQKARQGTRGGEDDVTRPPTPEQAAQEARPGAAQPGALAMRTPGPKSQNPGPNAPPAPPQSATGAGEEPSPADPPDPEGIRAPGGSKLQLQAPTPPGGGQPGGMPSAVPGMAALLPNQQQIARAIGSGTEDHLKDVDEGDETALNAKKWKFASFFNRVKAQVREHWKPADVYRRRDPTGAIYGNKDRYTLLRVQLKADGSLASVALEQPSGIEFLDDEAIEAFKSAQPFPNPPKQLVEASTGLIDFKFGFYFELSGTPQMKVFRYNSM
jgi:TonB family protein